MQNPSTMPGQPQLGTPVPGTTGGLPALGGLSVTKNPMAQELQSYGRGDDTMLVHMTPDEVNSLQGLALATGGSLTVNPHTGLPEAGWLGKLLPTLLGAGLTFIPGIGPLAAAGIVGAGQTAITGDLTKGLMAGLGAYGGASLAGALAPAAAGNVAAGAAGSATTAGATGATAAGTTPTALGIQAGTQAGGGAANLISQNLTKMAAEKGAVEAAKQGVIAAGTDAAAKAAAQKALEETLAKQVTKVPGLFERFGAEAAGGLGKGMLAKAAPMVAGLGLVSSISDATTPTGYKTSSGQIDNSFTGPYRAQERKATFAPTTEEVLSSSKERDYFNIDQPEIMDIQGRVVQPGSHTAPGTMIYQNVLNPKAKKGQPMYSQVGRPYMGGLMDLNDPQADMGYREGGVVHMKPGSFVFSARETSELAGGNTNKGQEQLAKLGGIPINGPGDGTSDSIKASIGGKQEARLANGEVLFPPEAVKRIGGGSEKRGTQKLYALMRKAEQSRKKAPRGADGIKLTRGLA